MPISNPFGALNKETTKGAALISLGQGIVSGQKDQSTLTFSGVAVDRETVTIDGDVFEVVDLSTDSTFDVGTGWDNTDAVVTQTHSSHSFSVGDYVCVESEIARVSFVSGDLVSFDRSGYAGTTVAAHSTGTTAIEVQEGTALTAGAITVPVADVTSTLVLSSLEDVVSRLGTAKWEVVKLSTTVGLILSKVIGSRGATMATDIGNATVVATSYGGYQPKVAPVCILQRVPTAAEVSAGAMYFALPFTPAKAFLYGNTTADWTDEVLDGSVTLDRTNKIATADNGGAADWATTTTVTLVVYGDPVACTVADVVG
ncbi:MAG: hypothetical protein ACWGQW_01880 [bacterium]